jgi:hypothetical protein
MDYCHECGSSVVVPLNDFPKRSGVSTDEALSLIIALHLMVLLVGWLPDSSFRV